MGFPFLDVDFYIVYGLLYSQHETDKISGLRKGVPAQGNRGKAQERKVHRLPGDLEDGPREETPDSRHRRAHRLDRLLRLPSPAEEDGGLLLRVRMRIRLHEPPSGKGGRFRREEEGDPEGGRCKVGLQEPHHLPFPVLLSQAERESSQPGGDIREVSGQRREGSRLDGILHRNARGADKASLHPGRNTRAGR